MKFKKTPQSKRSTYIYRYADVGNDGRIKNETEVILSAGENGVTAELIDKLHKLDDIEVTENLESVTVPCSKQEMQERREWSERNGGKRQPRKRNLSIEQCMERSDTDGANDVLASVSTYDRELSPDIMRLRELVEELPPFDRKIYDLVILNEFTKVEAAKILSVDEKTIRYHLIKIKAYIKNNFDR